MGNEGDVTQSGRAIEAIHKVLQLGERQHCYPTISHSLTLESLLSRMRVDENCANGGEAVFVVSGVCQLSAQANQLTRCLSSRRECSVEEPSE